MQEYHKSLSTVFLDLLGLPELSSVSELFGFEGSEVGVGVVVDDLSEVDDDLLG